MRMVTSVCDRLAPAIDVSARLSLHAVAVDEWTGGPEALPLPPGKALHQKGSHSASFLLRILYGLCGSRCFVT